MLITVRQALDMNVLKGSALVAGEAGLDNQIKSVTVLEIANKTISRWLVDGQLLISSFYAIYDDVNGQEEVILELAKSGCCAIILCNVDWLMGGVIDPRIIKLCDELEFPLIVARANLTYIEIMTPLINIIAEDQLLAKQEIYKAVSTEFIDLVINEERVERVLQKFNERLQKNISYYDLDGNCIYSYNDENNRLQEEQYVIGNMNHIINCCGQQGYCVQEINNTKKIFALIQTKRDVLGIIVIMDDGLPEDYEKAIINPLVIACSLLLRRKDRIERYQDKIRQEFVTDLLIWNFPSEDSAKQRGIDNNCEIEDINRLILINFNSLHIIGKTKENGKYKMLEQNLITQIIFTIKSYSNANWAAVQSDIMILFLNTKIKSFRIKEFCVQLTQILSEMKGLSFSIGISNLFYDANEIPEAYTQAFNAAVIGRSHYGECKIIFYDQVWFFQKLAELGNLPDTQEACNRFLEPIKTYDDLHKTELLKTLECMLQNQCNVQKTATQLFAHKNTIIQRKEKIISLLGFSPFEMPHLLNYLIVFDIYSFLN